MAAGPPGRPAETTRWQVLVPGARKIWPKQEFHPEITSGGTHVTRLLPRRVCIIAAAITLLTSSPTFAQPDVNGEDATLLKDFIHYVLIARLDLADGAGRALVDSNISDADLYVLVDELDIEDRLTDALVLAGRMDELQEVAGLIDRRISKGRMDRARDPQEIERHIDNLTGSARAQFLAEQALRNAGEFAVPQLLHVLQTNPSLSLKGKVARVLVLINRQAVTPLSVALPYLDPVTQEKVCGILEEIGYRHAIPALVEIAQDSGSNPQVAAAASKAADRLGASTNNNVAGLWLGLAENYWEERESLIAWPSEEENNIWNYMAGQGLLAVPVPTEVFYEVMAMRMSANALVHDASSGDALALWVASNFRRQDQLGDKEDPTYGANMRRPLFYAEAAGPEVAQRVLARANRDLNTPLARHAISVLESTAGGASLWTMNGARTPLVESLDFPERRVRYDAALALGRALPRQSFAGADRVVPILGSILRTGNEQYAAVIADNPEDARALAANLRSRGFTVLPPAASFDMLQPNLTGIAGVDLFLLKMASSRTDSTIAAIQSDARIAASPVLAILPGSEMIAARSEYQQDPRVSIVRLGANETQINNAIDNLIGRTLGGLITSDEADGYAESALHSLRDIAVSNTNAFDIADAEGALIEALGVFEGELYLTVAETLGWVGTQNAQRALLDAALNSDDELLKIELLNDVSDSAKRFGSFASDRHVSRLLQLVQNEMGPLATAAARAHGALNLPPQNVVPLIIR